MKAIISTGKNEYGITVSGKTEGAYSLDDVKEVSKMMADILIMLVKAKEDSDLIKGTVLYSSLRVINKALDKECRRYASNVPELKGKEGDLDTIFKNIDALLGFLSSDKD